ncbi:MAG: LysR family transcriptional regulator [Flavobacterium sp.]
MNYTLHQLQIFLKITETQSITKASEELHLTQPAVSIQLKNFQDQFDIPLTEVVGRKLYITEFGREISVAAQRILEEVATINLKTLAFKGQLSGKLKIASVSTGKYIIPFFLADFLNKHEGIDLVLDVTNKTRVIEAMENNEVDFSLVSLLPNKLNTEQIPLLKNKLFVVTKNDKKIKKDRKHFFENNPILFREKGSGTRIVMENFLKESEIRVNNKIELTSNEAVKQSILAGLGSSIMPLIGIKNELLNKELQIIPFKGFPIETTWYLTWLKGKKFSPVAQEYLDFISREKETIVQNTFGWYEQF